MKRRHLDQLIALLMIILIVDTPLVQGAATASTPAAGAGALAKTPEQVKQELTDKKEVKVENNIDSVNKALKETGEIHKDSKIDVPPEGNVERTSTGVRITAGTAEVNLDKGAKATVKMQQTLTGKLVAGAVGLVKDYNLAQTSAGQKVAAIADLVGFSGSFEEGMTAAVGLLGGQTHTTEVESETRSGKKTKRKISGGKTTVTRKGDVKVKTDKGEQETDITDFEEGTVIGGNTAIDKKNNAIASFQGQNVELSTAPDGSLRISGKGGKVSAYISVEDKYGEKGSSGTLRGTATTTDDTGWITIGHKNGETVISGQKATFVSTPNEKDIANYKPWSVSADDFSVKIDNHNQLSEARFKNGYLEPNPGRKITDSVPPLNNDYVQYFAKGTRELALNQQYSKVIIDESMWKGAVKDEFFRNGQGGEKDIIEGKQNGFFVTAKTIKPDPNEPGSKVSRRYFIENIDPKSKAGFLGFVTSEVYIPGKDGKSMMADGKPTSIKWGALMVKGKDGTLKPHVALMDESINTAALFKKNPSSIAPNVGVEFGPWKVDADKSGIMAASETKRGRQYGLFLANDALTAKTTEWRAEYTRREDAAIAAKQAALKALEGGGFTSAQIKEAQQIFAKLGVKKTAEDLKVMYYLDKKDAKSAADIATSRDNRRMVADAFSQSTDPSQQKTAMSMWGDLAKTAATEREGEELRRNILNLDGRLTGKTTFGQVDTLADEIAQGRANSKEYYKNDLEGSIRLMDANQRLADAVNFQGVDTEKRREADYISEIRSGGDAKAKTYELAVASDRIGLEQDAKDNYDLVRSHPDYYGGTNSDIVKNANARSKVIGDHLEQVVARQQAQLPAEELKKLGKSELEKIAKTLSGGSHSNEMRILGELYERRGQHDLAKQTYELGLVSSDLGAGSAAEKSLGQGRQTAKINTAVEQLPRLIQSNDFKGARALIEGISNDQKQKMEEYINNAENTKNTQDLIKNGNFAEAEATAKKITDAKTRETLLFRTYALSNDLTKLTESTSSFKDAGARDAAYDYLATTYEQRGLRASAEGLIDKIAGISPEEKALRKAMMYAGTDVSKKEHFLKQAEAILTREGAQNKEEYNMNMARYSALIGRNKDVVDSWYAAAIGDLQKAKQGATPEIIARLTEQEKSFTKEVQTLRAMDTNTRISEYTKKFSELGSQRETLRNQEGYLWNSEEIRNKVNTVNQKTAEAQKEYAAYFSTLSSAYIGLERWRIENGQYPDTPQIKQMKLDALKAAEESQRIMNKWASIPEITYRPEEIALNELTARGRELTTGIFLSNEIDGINKVQNDLTKALLEKQYGDRYAQYKLAENGGDIQKTLAAVRDDKTKFDQQLKNPYMDDIGRNNIRTFQTIVGNSLGTLEVATKPDLKVDSQTFSYLSAMRGNEINTVSRFKELNQIPLTDIERPMVDQQIYQLKASQDALSAKMYERLDTYTPTVRASIDKMTATTSVAAGVVKNNEITSFDKGLWGTGIRRFTDNLLQGSIGQAFESLADVSLASTYWSLGSDYDSTYSTYNKAFTDTIQSSKAARQLNEIAQMYPGVDIYDSKNLGKLTPEQQWIVQESIFKTKPQSIEEAYGGKSDSTYYTSGEAWKGATNLGNLGKVAASMAVAAVTTGGLGWLAGAIGLTKNVGTTTTAAANFLTNAFAFTVADEAINQIATGRYDASKFADTEFGTKLATNLVTFGAMHALGSATKPLSSYISGEGKAAIEAASKATTQPGGKAATAVIEAATKPISLPRSILAKSTEIGLTSAGMGAVFGTAEYVQRRLNGEILTAEDILTGYGSAALNGLIFTSLHQAATTAVTTAGTKVSSYLTEKALSSSAENVIKTATQFATKIGLDLRDPNKVADTLARAKLQQEGISAPTQEQVALAKSSIPKETINRATNPTASPVERAEPLRQIGRYLARTIAESQITEAEVLQKAKTLDNRGVGLEKMPETERAGLIERARQGLVEERIRNDLSRAKGNDALESQVRKGLTDAIEQEAAKPGEAILPWSDITDYQMAEAQYRKLTGQAELSSIDQKMFTLRGALPEEAFKKIIESSDYQGWIARQKTIEMDILSARQTLGELRTTAEALKGPEATSTKKPPLQDSTAYKDARVALEPTRLGTERMVLTNELSEARTSATDAQRELERLGSLADKPIENEAAFKEQAQSRGMTSEEARQEATRQATQRLEEANTKKTQLEAQLKENGDNILTANLEKAILQSPDSAVPVAAEARATSILAEITRVNQEKQRLSQTETSAKERARQLGEYERALNEALLKAHEQLNRAKAAVDSESPGVLDLLGRGGAYLTSRENLLKTKNELETAQARKIFSEDLIKRVEDAKKSRQIPNVEEIARKLAQESTDSRYARFANDAAEGIAKKAMTAEQTIESARSAAAERLDEAETRYKLAVKQFAEGQKQLLFDDNALAAQARMADAQMNAESTKAMLEKAKTAMSMAETNSIIQAMDLAMLIGDPQIKGILENINGISMLETGRSEAETVKAKDLRREEINRIVNEKMTGIEAAPGSAEHQAKLETEIKAAEAATAGKLTEYSQQAKQKVQEALQMMKAEAAQSTQKIRTADAKKTLEDIVKAEASKGNHAQIADTVRRETGLSNQDLVKLMGSERGKAPVIEERILEDREYSAQEKDSLERRVNEIEMKRKYSPLTIEETLELYRADKQARLLRLIDAKQQEVSDLVSSQGRQEGETATILEARISKARNELADLRTKKEASIKTSNEKLNLLQTLELRGWEYMTNKMGAGGRLANFDPFQVEAESIAYAQHLMGASTAMAGGKSSFVGPGILETSRSTLGMKGVFLTTQGLAFAQNQIMAEKFAMLGRKVYFLDGLDKLADRLTKTQEADFVVVGDQTIGFLLTKLWDPNTPVNERLAAKGIIGELTTNRHIFADEADSVWKPKNRYISGGKQTSPPVEKLAIASSVNTIFERMGLYVLDKNGNEAYRAKIVDGSEQTSIKTIASATSCLKAR